MDGAGTNMCRAVQIEGLAMKATYCSRVCVGDSDDSDTEGGLGNVERVVMRPPGHSGKAKRGHLCFDAAFETGNLGRVDFITENEYDLFIRPDTGNPRIRFWCHFSVENVQADQRIIFNIVNLSKTKNLFQKGMTPVVKSTSRPRWQRLPAHQVYYYRSPEHSHHSVLSFAFAFDAQDTEKYYFALGYPYSYSRCMAMLKQLEEERPSDRLHVDREFAKSVQNRCLPKVTIPGPATPKSDDDELQSDNEINDNDIGDIDNEEESQTTFPKSTVIILSRTHPGESNTSYAIQGLLEFLTSDHTIARDLRSHIEIVVFPMMNPDGVFLGNSRSSLFGVDFNRSWNQSGPYPIELYPVKKFILDLAKERNVDFVLGSCDFYGNWCLSGLFVQGNSFDSVYRFERHIVFPKLLAQNSPDFDVRNTMYNADVDKEGTCRRFLSNQIGDTTNVYSIEMSLYGYRLDDGTCAAYSEEDYLMHGRRIARSLWEYFKVTTVIPEPMFAAPASSAAQLWAAASAANTTEAAATKESSFSMLRLKDISEQKDIFSSLESLGKDSTTSGEDQESGDENPATGGDGGETSKTKTLLIHRAFQMKRGNSGNDLSLYQEQPVRSRSAERPGQNGDWLVVGKSITFERPYASSRSRSSSESSVENGKKHLPANSGEESIFLHGSLSKRELIQRRRRKHQTGSGLLINGGKSEPSLKILSIGDNLESGTLSPREPRSPQLPPRRSPQLKARSASHFPRGSQQQQGSRLDVQNKATGADSFMPINIKPVYSYKGAEI